MNQVSLQPLPHPTAETDGVDYHLVDPPPQKFFKSTKYLVTVDYFSNFWEVDRLTDTRACAVILKWKNYFARYGCSDEVVSDDGPQFSAEEFAKFTRIWDFSHYTSSPRNSRANGKAESSVKLQRVS
ncbi:hypothetical protein QZH41_014649 [Actinostola sp. cb2023]|nr:hypothetical protein QZH41_014649 [Actinostola sp. cb2023]